MLEGHTGLVADLARREVARIRVITDKANQPASLLVSRLQASARQNRLTKGETLHRGYPRSAKSSVGGTE